VHRREGGEAKQEREIFFSPELETVCTTKRRTRGECHRVASLHRRGSVAAAVP